MLKGILQPDCFKSLYCLNPTGLSFWKSASRKVYAIQSTKEEEDEIVVIDEHEEHARNAHAKGMLFCKNTVKVKSRLKSCVQ